MTGMSPQPLGPGVAAAAPTELQPVPSNGIPRAQGHHATLNEENFQERPLTAEGIQTFPEGGLRAWSVVAGSFAIICPTFGLASCAGIFQAYWEANQLAGYSSSSIGWIIAVNLFLNLGLGIQVGPVFDRYGPQGLLIVGSVGYVTSILLLAQCSQFWQIMLVFGVVMGFNGALLTTTAISVIAHWFKVKRGQASGLAIMGSSLGGILFPLMLKPMFDRLGWAWSMRTFGLIVTGLLIVGNICIRGRLRKRTGAAIDLRCFRDKRFVWATIGLSSAEFCLFGAIGLLPTYALFQGFSSKTSFNIVAVYNGGSALGRLAAGQLSDTWGRFNSMVSFIAFSALAIFCLWIPISTPSNNHSTTVGYAGSNEANISKASTGLLYAFSVIFGIGSGSIISLAPVCFGQLCGVEQYGQYYGTSYSIVSFATLICIPIGGALLPAVGPQVFAAFFGCIMVLSLAGFLMARWACLDYKWKWRAVI